MKIKITKVTTRPNKPVFGDLSLDDMYIDKDGDFAIKISSNTALVIVNGGPVLHDYAMTEDTEIGYKINEVEIVVHP